MTYVEEQFSRAWNDLLARDSGFMHLRLILQPVMAAILAIRTGLADAREGRPYFIQALALQPEQRRPLLAHLWRDVRTLFLVACVLDLIYQLIVLRWFYPLQTLIVATALAVLPYFLIRGLANRFGRLIGVKGPEKGNEHG